MAIVLSLIYNFRETIVKILKNFFFYKKMRMFCYNIVLATLPSMIFGLTCHRIIRKYLYKNKIIAIFLAIGGLLMIVIEKYRKRRKISENDYPYTLEDVSAGDMYKIGISQAISLIPGISRSASTIGVALFLGLPRVLAIDFSFFLSVPVSVAGLSFDLYREFSVVRDNCLLLSVCFIFNIFFSLFIIKKIMKYLKTNKLYFFGYYRIALAVAIFMLG
jgi:undecaprenyl-diphosphatase